MHKINLAYLYYFIGVSIVSIILIAPDTIPAFGVSKDEAWMPMPSSNYRFSDAPYYASNVNELLEGQLLPEYVINSGKLSLESTRIASLYLATLPGLLFEDFRVWMTAGYLLSAWLIFSIYYVLGLKFNLGYFSAFSAAIFGYSYGIVWEVIPSDIFLFNGGSLEYVYERLLSAINHIIYVRDIHFLGGKFRYFQPSLSFPFCIAYFYLVYEIYRGISTTKIILLYLLGCILAFTYPSLTIAAYFLLISGAVHSLIVKNWKLFRTFFYTGLSILFTLIVSDYFIFVKSVYESNVHFSNAHILINFENISWPDINNYKHFLLNKLTTTSILMYLVFRKYPKSKSFFQCMIIFSFLYSSFNLFDFPRNTMYRLHERGIDNIWFIFIVISAAVFVSRLNLRIKEKINNRNYKIYSSVHVYVVIALIMLPVASTISSGIRNIDFSNRVINKSNWEAYKSLNRIVPANAIVLTTDWDDIHYIPMATHADLMFGDKSFSGRVTEEELIRLIISLKALGIPKEKFINMINRSIDSDRSRIKKYVMSGRNPKDDSILRTPYLDDPLFESAAIARYVLRYQSMPEYKGIKIHDEDYNINNEFLIYIASIWDKTPDCDRVVMSEVEYLFIRNDFNYDWRCSWELEEVWSNQSHSIIGIGN